MGMWGIRVKKKRMAGKIARKKLYATADALMVRAPFLIPLKRS